MSLRLIRRFNDVLNTSIIYDEHDRNPTFIVIQSLIIRTIKRWEFQQRRFYPITTFPGFVLSLYLTLVDLHHFILHE